MKLHSIVRPQKPGIKPRNPHKIFENKFRQDFHADKPNQKWCTDFTYLFLKNRDVRYHCAILDLYDRSVVASITDRHITSDLAIRTLKKAFESQHLSKGGLILHSDQGSQYTSNSFIEFCESVQVTQSMSKAGYPYDNAPMERDFNTLKNECTNLYEFQTEEHCTGLWKNSPISPITMCARTVITTIAHPTRHERQHEDRREQVFRLDCLITQHGGWEFLSMAWPRSSAKHH